MRGDTVSRMSSDWLPGSWSPPPLSRLVTRRLDRHPRLPSLTADVTPLVKSWLAGANNGLKFEMTGGYVNFTMKGFRLEVTVE